MLWFSDGQNELPRAIEQVKLSAGTIVNGKYRILGVHSVNGLELVYDAEEIEQQEKLQLLEFLPLQWCMRDENHVWTPYHAVSGIEWESVRIRMLTRAEKLCAIKDEAALMQYLSWFEANGTIWMVQQASNSIRLSDPSITQLMNPDEAVQTMAPVLDTLAGLHQEELYHGNLSLQIIHTYQNKPYITGWFSCMDTPESALSQCRDVIAVSTVLYQLMTGESEYRKQTAAALPATIRRALQNGMAGNIESIEALWMALHSKQAVFRKKQSPKQAKKDSIWDFLTPRFVICFTLICCAIPVFWYYLKQSADPISDTSYQLADGELCVPELLYLSQEDAITKAEALGLRIIVGSRSDNPVVPEGAVVTQDPPAGTIVRPGDTIVICVSDGWYNYVPNVCNLLLEDARAALEAEGFIVEYEEVHQNDSAPGTVISQSIAPETLLERGNVIKLVVSLGREDLDVSKLESVENYVGMDFEEAKQKLSERHLYALQAEAVYDPEIPAGIIISQDIAAGNTVPQGTIINMVVSLGVEMTRVPGVGMMNAASARALLEDAGLRAVLTYTANSSYAKDCVISQSVAAGQLVPIGSEIWLTISLGQDSYVVSTGGWSGNDLPEGDTLLDDSNVVSEESDSDTTDTQSESLTSESDMSDQSDASETNESTVSESQDMTDISATDPTESEMTDDTAPSESAEPLTDPPETAEPTEAVPSETQNPDIVPST